jgi:hypothetical protein
MPMPMRRILSSACLLLASAAPLAAASTDCGLAVASLESLFGAPVRLHDAHGDGSSAPRRCRFLAPDLVIVVQQRNEPGDDAETLPFTAQIAGAPALAWRRGGVVTEVQLAADALLREAGSLSDSRAEQLRMRLQALRDGTPMAPLVASDADCGGKPFCLRDAGDGLLRQPLSGLLWTQVQGPAGDWQSAEAWCRGRGEGWRLPRRIEFAALSDTEGGRRNPCGRQFCAVSPLLLLAGSGVWSAERDGRFQMWAADLALQREHPMNPDYVANRALCVRDPA